MVSTPKPESAASQAAAQTGLNRDTALTQQQINMVNQVTPDGTLTYDQTGTSKFQDSKGNWVETPTYTATTALSPAQQAIKDQTDGASLNLGTLANQQSGFLKDYLAKPFQADTAEAEARLNELGSARLDPRFAQETDALRTQLISSGIRPGTAAFDQQMQQLGQTKNDAYNQLYLNGRSQALSEAYAERAQPINEISALMSGAQVAGPQFTNTPQTSVAGADYIGASQANFQAESQAAQAKMGGLFGLAAAPFSMFKFSDRRLKKDVRTIGYLPNGLPWYEYRYLSDEDRAPIRRGVMSDDVRKVMPSAVIVDPASGFDKVNYGMVLEAA